VALIAATQPFAKDSKMTTTQCTRCQREVPGYDGVHQSDGKGGDRGFVCGRCWAELLSKHVGEELSHIEIAPIILWDCEENRHEFHFRYNPSPGLLTAFEYHVDLGGYDFSVLAEEDESSLSLTTRLLEKIRQGLSRQHLESSSITPGCFRIKDTAVRGRIDVDTRQSDRVPCVTIDGKPIPWEQFGHMVMQFEGWHFRVEFLDHAEED